MKIFIQALIASFLVHIIYFLSPIVIGYIQTNFYTPDITTAYENVNYLQNEGTFGGIMMINPFFVILSFLGVALLYGFIIIFFKKIRFK